MIKTLALIMARGGSVGLPGKNMRLLGGKPLVQWTIETAKDCGIFEPNRIVVSSDWDDVLTLAKSLGVNPVRRPDSLCTGFERIEEIVDHTLRVMNLDNDIPTQIVILNPTSPFRTTEDIITLSKKVQSSPKFTGGMTVKETYLIPMRNLGVGVRGYQGFWRLVKEESSNRQERKPMIVQNGAVYIINGDFYRETRRWFGMKQAAHLMPQERSLDIDTIWDFLAAEAYVSEFRKVYGKPS